jgi:hypothetical protein
MNDLIKELAATLNRHSMENGSDTPDFILATYLTDCLNAFNPLILMQPRGFGFTTEPIVGRDPSTKGVSDE